MKLSEKNSINGPTFPILCFSLLTSDYNGALITSGKFGCLGINFNQTKIIIIIMSKT